MTIDYPIKSPRKLIEVALPLDAINAACSREKSIRHGHPSTLHLWWARRPLAAARAVIFAQLVNDPGYQHGGGFKYGMNKKEAAIERKRLFKIIEDLVLWENTTNETVLERARAEIRRSWREVCELNNDHPQAAELFNPDKLPALHDPFAGGGSIPLEAQRLGLEAYASDLNPVAVLINKAMIEIPPKFAGRPPVNPEVRRKMLGVQGAQASRLLFFDDAWRNRGYLPHFDRPGMVQSITFRLADSLPHSFLQQCEQELASLPEYERQTEKEKRIAAWLDRGEGECLLRDERINELVEQAILHFDGQRYRLLAWCVMPNHVHVMIETFVAGTAGSADVPRAHSLASILHSWKSFTAKEANKILGRTGAFWQVEYYDRCIRDTNHFNKTRRYIEENPVTARLVGSAENWRRSSAWKDGKAGGTHALPVWKGSQGLAEDVRYYGTWMREEARRRIGHLYPPVEITAEMAAGSAGVSPARPDLLPLVGQKLTVIAWLWARTVKSPNPAFSHVNVPLVSTFILSSKEGKEVYVQPVIEGDRYRFTVKVGTPPTGAKEGTKLARGANFRCLISNTAMTHDYTRGEFQAKRNGECLMAIVAEGDRGRIYLAPTPEQEAIAKSEHPAWRPEQEMNQETSNLVSGRGYGITHWHEIFTPRQLVALTTFSDLVAEARQRVLADCQTLDRAAHPANPTDPRPLDQGGSGPQAYAEAVSVYLAFAINKMCDRGSSICGWDSSRDSLRNTFGRQAIPMVWDFAEANFIEHSAGSYDNAIDQGVRVIREYLPAKAAGFAVQADAQNQKVSQGKAISSDPPYYDNIGYADLSDFFYVWLRKALRSVFPTLLSTIAVPKAEELVAAPYRHGSKEKAENFFLTGMTQALQSLAMQAHPAGPITIYYAFKQSDTQETDGTSSTGWVTFLEAVHRAGLQLSGTWPMRTELSNRMIGSGTNALASSIVLVCRKRPVDAPSISRREFIRELNGVLPEALDNMTRGADAGNTGIVLAGMGNAGGTPALPAPIAPVDLSQAIIGPGMAVFTKYTAVLEADGSPMSVRTALQLINRFLAEDDFDADTQFCLHWFEQHGWNEGAFGDADTLSRGKGTSVDGMKEAGVLQSGGGKVRLLKWAEYPTDWDPATDTRTPVWEALHQLIRALKQGGESASGALLASLGGKAEAVRQLAYRLYTLCERLGQAEDARAYNELITSWTGIESASTSKPKSFDPQLSLFETEGSNP